MTYDIALELFAVLLALIGIALMAFVAHYAQAPRLDAPASKLAADIAIHAPHAPRAPRSRHVNLRAVFIALVLLALTRLLLAKP